MKERPSRTLREKAMRHVGRPILAGVARAELGLYQVGEEFAQRQETYTKVFHGPVNALGYATKTLQVKWEELRFEMLQRPAAEKAVTKRRGKIKELEDTLEDTVDVLQKKKGAWKEEMKRDVREADGVLAVAGFKIPDPWMEGPDLLEAVRAVRADLAEDLEAYRDPERTASTTVTLKRMVAKKSSIERALNALHVLEGKIKASSWGDIAIFEKNSVNAPERELKKKRKAGAIPEAAIRRREELLRERDELLKSIHAAELKCVRFGRKVEGKKEDVVQLFVEREDPRINQRKREVEATEDFIAVLEELQRVALNFETLPALRGTIANTKKADEVGHRPTVLEVRRYLERAHVPDAIRDAFTARFPNLYAFLRSGDIEYFLARLRPEGESTLKDAA